jgi:G3E family GTPase
MTDERIPVFLLTGFLGSGKTTLLNALLPHYPDSALVINELGDIGIDDQLIEEQSVPVTLLAGGCICCTVRGNLNSTLRNLWMSRRAGSVPAFSRLIVETTGAADPWGLIETLTRDSFLRRHYRFAAVLTTVDASRGAAGLRQFPEVMEQVLVADTLLMTRADQVEAQALAEFRMELAALNPAARIEAVQPGHVPGQLLDDAAQARCRVTGLPTLVKFSVAAVPPDTAPLLKSGVTRHSNIRSASLRLQSPLERWSLMRALEQLLGENDRYLLRFKGLFHLKGEQGPLLVQAVAQGMDEPRSLQAWPDGDHDSRMVLIVDHPDADFPAKVLARLESLVVHAQT